MAAAFWPCLTGVSGNLSAAEAQPFFRDTPGRLVCSGASGRGLGGDVRGVADAEEQLACRVRGLAGAAEAGVCG